jgi:hypothetical protein
MLHRRVRQPKHSRYSNSDLQTHLRELVAQSSHGRPARSPTKPAWRQLPNSEQKHVNQNQSAYPGNSRSSTRIMASK